MPVPEYATYRMYHTAKPVPDKMHSTCPKCARVIFAHNIVDKETGDKLIFCPECKALWITCQCDKED